MNIDPSLTIYLNRSGNDPFQSGSHGSHLAAPPSNLAWEPGDIDFSADPASAQNNQELASQLAKLILALLSNPQSPDGDPGGSGGYGKEPPASGSCGGTNLGKPPSSFAADPNSGGEFNAGPNEKLNQWGGAISKASQISGFDPNLIGGQIWAESRGDPGTSTTNTDGSNDIGLMQISQKRWDNDVLPNLSDEQKQKIRSVTGKDPSELDMSNPEDNVIAGSLELKQWYDQKGGNIEDALFHYVSGGDPNIGSPTYVQDVLGFAETLKSGGKLPD